MGLRKNTVLDAVERLDGVVSKYIPTKEKRAGILEGAQKIMNDVVQERMRMDMSSDSWLSKNVRPLMLIIVVGSYILLHLIKIVLASFMIAITIDIEFIGVIKTWGSTMIAFYYGGRMIEKVVDIVKKRKRH